MDYIGLNFCPESPRKISIEMGADITLAGYKPTYVLIQSKLGGAGFGKHPHDNMEIISIPLEGDLEHRDSTGRHAIIRQGDVQIMSAGTGVVQVAKVMAGVTDAENDPASLADVSASSTNGMVR